VPVRGLRRAEQFDVAEDELASTLQVDVEQLRAQGTGRLDSTSPDGTRA